MIVTLVTAGLCGLLFFILSIRVSTVRVKLKISLGDGDNNEVLSRVRAHANFAEYVPIILILIGVIEYRVGASGLLKAAGALLILARVSHIVGVGRPAPNPFRVAGITGTWVVLIATSVWAIFLAYASTPSYAPGLS